MAEFDYDNIPYEHKLETRRPGPDIDDIFKLVRAIGLVCVWSLAVAFGLACIVLIFQGNITFGLFMGFFCLLLRPWNYQ